MVDSTLIAFQRFGLGAKPGGATRVTNGLAALKAEIATPKITDIGVSGLLTYEKACSDSQRGFDRAEKIRQAEVNARIDKQMKVEIGFVERLVMFWANHFSMTVNKSETVRGTRGQWERDVVRKNVLGKFGAMLLGTFQHPAMIGYLDNEDSIGPNSPIGIDWQVGLNENLARETMELHTLGSGGGYTETDVTAFAKILTGWSYVRGWEADGRDNGGNAKNRGQFIYRANWHEPGVTTLMGKDYPASQQEQARLALADFAAHPATAEHIAFKLVRHFITDEPTPAMVDPLKQKFLQTGGDLKAVSLALLDLPESWSTPLTKIRTPYEMSIATYRALGKRYKNNETWALSEPLYALNNMVWESPSPEGYSDETLTWLNPDASRIRIDLAQFSSWEFAPKSKLNVVALANGMFGAALSSDTRTRLASADGPNDALTILFSCPEFQRR
jgi:uncharacterized protein (DUF1800 family)